MGIGGNACAGRRRGRGPARASSLVDTANRLKRSIEFWRGAALGLAILGAVLATVASQSGQGTSWARWTSGLAAVALALVPVIRGAKLGRSAVEAWTRARSASEALKSAA